MYLLEYKPLTKENNFLTCDNPKCYNPAGLGTDHEGEGLCNKCSGKEETKLPIVIKEPKKANGLEGEFDSALSKLVSKANMLASSDDKEDYLTSVLIVDKLSKIKSRTQEKQKEYIKKRVYEQYERGEISSGEVCVTLAKYGIDIENFMQQIATLEKAESMVNKPIPTIDIEGQNNNKKQMEENINPYKEFNKLSKRLEVLEEEGIYEEFD